MVINKSSFTDLSHVWEPYNRLDVLCLAFIYAGHSMEKQKLSGFGIKDCLTEASLEWKCFRSHNKDRQFYSFNVKYVRDFIRKLIKCWSIAAFNTYFESNECELIL